jgi:endonuclease-3
MNSLKEQIKEVISILEKEYPNPKTALEFKTPHQLLVATILSAQCTDKRVNIVTKDLFKKYKTIKAFAEANLSELEKDIYATGFYRNKAKNIVASFRMIMEKFKGKVPENMEELIELPGVARKTANVVLSGIFGKEEGIAVDTHVRRISNLLGLSANSDPEKIEQDLMENTAQKDWSKLSHLLVYHGRNVCDAKKPKCKECSLSKICSGRK